MRFISSIGRVLAKKVFFSGYLSRNFFFRMKSFSSKIRNFEVEFLPGWENINMELVSSGDVSGQKELEVVFLIDITGSMGNQIEGVKQMVSAFCQVDRPMINIHIWTFTESPGCHVTRSPKNLKSKELVEYTQSIKLCCPPGLPNVNAGGGDGPENVTAGIASLLDEFESNENLLCFVITDAPPHHLAYGMGKETKTEIEWLKNKGFEDTDIFVVLCEVIDSLNVTFVPVLFGQAIQNVFYQQAAAMTDGILLCPISSNSELLASGLVMLLEAFQKVSVSRDLQLVSNLDIEKLASGFKILAVPEDLKIIETDPKLNSELQKSIPYISSSKDILEKILGLFKTTIDRFSGKKSAKRCKTVNPEHMSKSIKLFLHSLLYTTSSKLHQKDLLDRSISELSDLLTTLKSSDQKYEWEHSMLTKYIKDLDSLKENFQNFSKTEKTSIECMVSLEKVAQSLQGLVEIPVSEQELSQWMDLILQLCVVRLINVRFPNDSEGKPDFADAWSATFSFIEYSSVLSAASALQLRSKEDFLYTAPVTLTKNNAALIVAHPDDRQLTQIYKSLSYFPTLQGLIQSHLVSGSFKVFPSILQGLQASVFWHITRQVHEKSYTDSQWELIRCIVHSLRNSAYNVTPSIYSSLKEQKCLNPVDNISKLLAGYLNFFNTQVPNNLQTALRLLFEELSADCIAYEFRKRLNPDNANKCNLPTDKEITECFVDFEEIQKFDPCSGIHFFEDVVKGNQQLSPDFIERISEKLKNNCKTLKNAVEVFKVFCNVLAADLNKSSVLEAFDRVECKELESVVKDEELQGLFVESFLLRKRTGRYSLDETSKEWKRESLDRVDKKVLYENCVKIVADTLNEYFLSWNSVRKNNILNVMIKRILEFDGHTIEDYNKFLSSLEHQIGPISLKFSRIYSMAALNALTGPDLENKLRTVGLSLLLGDWTNAPPSSLRRSLPEILKIYSNLTDLHPILQTEILKEVVCSRPAGSPNRHGHTVENQFPGIRNWSQEYEDRILSFNKGNNKKVHLAKMKEFTLFYQQTVDDLANSQKYCKDQSDLISLCVSYSKNENQLELTKKLVADLAGLNFEACQKFPWWATKVEEVKQKLKVSKRGFLHLENLIKSIT